MNLIYSGSSLLFIWPIGDTQRCSKTHERTLSSLLNVTKSFMTLMDASDFGITNLQTKSPLPLKSKICHEHVLWMADAQESMHPSYDDTAGCSLAQNHRDKRKSRLSTRMPQGMVLRKPQRTQRLVCCSPGGPAVVIAVVIIIIIIIIIIVIIIIIIKGTTTVPVPQHHNTITVLVVT